MAYFVVRIAGQVKNLGSENETMNRLKLRKKFSAIFVEEDDAVRMGMVKSVDKKVAYGKVSEEFVKELNEKRPAKNGIYFLHPARGGFKKSSRLPTPKGILGEHEDLVKLVGRML
jgi:ribosomal protein L30/L7E|tara:strand:+ start:412 stop:756 length:345 start_codon:yes stop_codon:yes gene_type:complete